MNFVKRLYRHILRDAVTHRGECGGGGERRGPPGNPGANLGSISHRCHLFEVAFTWELTKETMHLLMGCLQGGYGYTPWGGQRWRRVPRPPRRSSGSSTRAGPAPPVKLIRPRQVDSSFSALLLSSLELSDAKVYEPYVRALLETASDFCEVVVNLIL